MKKISIIIITASLLVGCEKKDPAQPFGHYALLGRWEIIDRGATTRMWPEMIKFVAVDSILGEAEVNYPPDGGILLECHGSGYIFTSLHFTVLNAVITLWVPYYDPALSSANTMSNTYAPTHDYLYTLSNAGDLILNYQGSRTVLSPEIEPVGTVHRYRRVAE